MTADIPDWFDIVLDDLRAVSGDLLHRGMNQPRRLQAHAGHGPALRSALAAVDLFLALAPALLGEVAAAREGPDVEVRAATVPRRARLPVSPHDYVWHEGRALPRRWIRLEAEQVRDDGALRWLLYLCQWLQQHLRPHTQRLLERVAEALMVRAGDSDWAVQDAATLRALAASGEQRAVALKHMELRIQSTAGQRIAPSERLPEPFPRAPGWGRLKQLVHDLRNPSLAVAAVLGATLHGTVETADLPYLYQRWCGLQIARALERAGWQLRGDLTGPLFLGGCLEGLHDGHTLTLWIEPRICRATMAATGWLCAAPDAEVTPDFLITCGSPGDRDAFVLDATLATSDAVLRNKGKYRKAIAGADPMAVAGVPVPRRPIRSWAVAPLAGGRCWLGDPEGRTGAIPLRPGTDATQALDAWVGDVVAHALRRGALV